MAQNWQHLPAPARPVATGAVSAVAAARNRDGEALAEAASDLAALDPGHVGLILGTTVRLLLEETHPDGLTGDDIRAVLEHCVRASTDWQPEVDPHVVLTLLASALGVPADDGPPPKPDSVARHAALLIADLMGETPAGDQHTETYLTRAMEEIERAQLND